MSQHLPGKNAFYNKYVRFLRNCDQGKIYCIQIYMKNVEGIIGKGKKICGGGAFELDRKKSIVLDKWFCFVSLDEMSDLKVVKRKK